MLNIPITKKYMADGAIERLRSELLKIDWLQFVYGAAQIGINQIDKSRYPELFAEKNLESVKIYPDNNVKSFCFFEKIKTRIANDFNMLNTYFLKICVWLNFNLLNDVKKNNIDYYVYELTKLLKKHKCYDLYVNYEDIFQKYGMEYSQNQYFMFPFGKFSVDFFINDNDFLYCG